MVLFLIYVAVSAQREMVNGRDELFPFSAWSLFTIVPNDVHDYSLRLLAINDRPVAPEFLEQAQARGWFAANRHGAYMTVQFMGMALDRGDVTGADQQRRLLERLHLTGHGSITYELVARRYDPIDRFRSGKFEEIRTIATCQTSTAEVQR
jgi:hypothetical protein